MNEAKSTPKFESLDDVVRHAMEKTQTPGVTVGILHGGEVEAYGYGVISLETNYPTRPDTLFQIGSNTKVFTATLAMMLVEEGKLDLDTPVHEYLPDLRLADEQALNTINMRHLLTHMSGLEGDIFEDYGIGDDALAKGIEAAVNWKQEREPGEVWSYCNSGFYLAGRVIEHIVGQPFESIVAERVFAPLGLERSFWFAQEAIMYSAAAGHNQNPGEDAPTVAHPWAIPRASNPAGAIISNVEDLLKFCAFHMGDGTVDGEQVLSRESIQAMQSVQARVNSVSSWGIGWSLDTRGGVDIIRHGGGTNGHITQMLAVPEQNFALSVLTNSSRGGEVIGPVEKWLLEKYCGIVDVYPEPVEVPAEELDRLVGKYGVKQAQATITRHEKGLQIDASMVHPLTEEQVTFPPVVIAPIGSDEFIVVEGEDDEDGRVEFITSGDTVRYIRFGGRLYPRTA